MNRNEIDTRFRDYVNKNLRRGDKARLAALLEVSYPTLQNYITGVSNDPIRQGVIMDFFEQRKMSETKMTEYVKGKIEEVYKNIEPQLQPSNA
jgi:hypothetical protein